MAYLAKKKRNRRAGNSQRLNQMFDGRNARPCYYCGERVRRSEATFDHKVALSQGGYDKKSNGVIACGKCNAEKGSMSVEQYKALRASRK